MKRLAALSLLLSLCAATASAQEQKNEQDMRKVYASENCKTGCFAINQSKMIYFGSVPRSYRICTNDFGAEVVLNNERTLEIPGSRFGVRSCQDVAANSIQLKSGEVSAGLLP